MRRSSSLLTARYLSLADFLVIAEAVLGLEAELLARVTDLGLAESAINAPAAGFAHVELYPDLLDKAAVLCARIVKNHALPNGNKRVAFECMRTFLAENGYEWIKPDSPDEIVHMLVDVATGTADESTLSTWIAARTRTSAE